MARTQKDTVSYFPHDSNACAGDTVTVLQGRFGNDGYAFWFKLLEKLSSSEGHFLDCSNSTKWQLLLVKTGVDELTGVEIMKLLVEMQAIDKELWESGIIWCQKLVENIADVYKNRRREIPQKPFSTNHNGITTDNNPITPCSTLVESTQSKVKKSKVNKNTNALKQKFGEFLNVFLTPQEHEKLITEFGKEKTATLIETLSRGIESKGYKYKNYYVTILNWEKRDNGSTKTGPGKLPATYSRPEDLLHD